MKPAELDLFARLMQVRNPTAPSEGGAVEAELKRSEEDFGVPLTLRNLFTHHDTHPVVLDVSLLKAFGLEWWSWEPETIWAEVERTFKTQMSEHAKQKIQAMQTLHVSVGPWASWNVFEKVAQALNNNLPDWRVMQAPTLEQLYAAVDIMDSVRHEEFADEVKQYMAAAVLHEDVFYVPEPLAFLQDFVSHPHYRCRDCGNEDSALFHDGTCDTCTSKFDPEHNLSMRPSPEAVAAGKGKNLETVLRFPFRHVEDRWKEVAGQPLDKVQFALTQEDVQVGKLLVARDYMNIRRRQLAEQLTSLKSWLGAT